LVVHTPLTRRRVRLLIEPGVWADIARDAVWTAWPKPTDPPEPTSPIDAERTSRVRLRWPRTYEFAPSASYFEWVRNGFARHLPIEEVDLPQPYPGLVLFELEADGDRHLVAVDYYDFMHVNEEAAARCTVYFKMQHREEGYDLPQVLPGGYVARRERLYRFLSRLRAARDRREFAFDVYGRFGLRYRAEIRGPAARLLSDQTVFAFEGGTKLAVYSRHLRDVARSRVCIDLPGQGPLCSRLVDLLAIGSCVVGVRPRVKLPVPLENGRQVAWVRDDLSDLVETCRRYVEDDEAREAMALEARRYFDNVLHRDQLADYYLDRCLERVIGPASVRGAASARKA
jgi:hypothetical protein